MAQPAFSLHSDTHAHSAEAVCPTCDQPVPNEKLSEINARLQAQEQEISERLGADFDNRLAQVSQAAKAELAKVANDNAATIEQLKIEAAQREIAVREQVRADTEASLKEQVAESVRLRQAAEEVVVTKARELKELQTTSNATIETLKQREITARAEAKAEAEAIADALIAESTNAREVAEAQLAALCTSQQERLNEQRVALEKHEIDAINAEKAKAFEDKLKMETQLKDMARKLEQKTADERGEGAEVKLLEDLQERFEGDKFTHVGKGNAGADIIHEVMHNGKICGKIVYDSKNRNAWRNEYVSKLRKDQVAAEADHAILSTQTFPAGTKQMHIQDGVLIANPARVLILVDLLREQVVRTHKLRLSNESKGEKTAALYKLITGELSAQLFNQIELSAESLLELDVKEKKAHDVTWKRRGELTRSIQKAHGDLNTQIELVLGTALNDRDTEE